MTIKNTFKRLILLFTIGLLFSIQACSPPKPGVYQNDQIPSGTKSKLHDLNALLLSALKTNNPEDLELLMSKDYIDDRHNRLVTTEHISNIMKTSGEYGVMAEYYMVNPNPSNKTTIKERDKGINNYDVTFAGGTNEMYVALLTPKTAIQKSLITAVYRKFDYGWKIDGLEVNPYAENGKTAPELIELAKQQLKNGYWLDASNTASYAVNCFRPISNWKYVSEGDMYKFNSTALDAVTAHCILPMVVKDVATHPRIWRIRIERTPEGSFPNINYISTINLFDTVALKKENELVGKEIGKLITGVDKDKKYIYYTIYNKNAKGIPVQDHYDLRQTLK